MRGAAIGGGSATLFFMVARLVQRNMTATPGGDQIEGMFGGVSLGFGGYLVIAALSGAIAVLTGWMSRIIVLRSLRELD